jgi:hypothetical protein
MSTFSCKIEEEAMPHWEEELLSLLTSLGVVLEREESSLYLLPSPIESRSSPTSSRLENTIGESEVDIDQADLVRSEIEATLAEVVRSTRQRHLETRVRDDIVYIMRALMRPVPTTVDDTEWQGQSSAAILHFCRVVVRLIRALEYQE